MSETITAVYRHGTASGVTHNREVFGTVRQETYAGVPTGLYIIGRNGYRIVEVERSFAGWVLRIGDRTDMDDTFVSSGTYPDRMAALLALVRRELRANPDHITVS